MTTTQATMKLGTLLLDGGPSVAAMAIREFAEMAGRGQWIGAGYALDRAYAAMGASAPVTSPRVTTKTNHHLHNHTPPL